MALNMKSAEEEHEEGAPAWMVTYGDMMSLLLCFFIMLVAMSEIKDEKFQRLLESIKQAFGAHDTAIEVVPGPKEKASSAFDNIQLVMTVKGSGRAGGAELRNVHGRELRCKTIREGTVYAVGDKVGFDAGGAALAEELRKDLDAIVKLTQDYSNRLLVRGYASVKEPGGDDGQWELAFRRAVVVKDYLVSKGINPSRIQLTSSGRFDPVDTPLTEAGRRANRRVEVVVSPRLTTGTVPGREIDE